MERVAEKQIKETTEKLNQQQSFQERCLMLDIRMTSQRRLLASVLNESSDHPDVDTIYQRCNAKEKLTSIASIYRS
jgi:Fur family transcriptional regulator, ferric uptake regulator